MKPNAIGQVISEGSIMGAKVDIRFANCMEIELQDLWYVFLELYLTMYVLVCTKEFFFLNLVLSLKFCLDIRK